MKVGGDEFQRSKGKKPAQGMERREVRRKGKVQEKRRKKEENRA